VRFFKQISNALTGLTLHHAITISPLGIFSLEYAKMFKLPILMEKN